jgi:hypothetical protein
MVLLLTYIEPLLRYLERARLLTIPATARDLLQQLFLQRIKLSTISHNYLSQAFIDHRYLAASIKQPTTTI